MKQNKIGVLMGGISSEREVSLDSGKAVLDALICCGYNAVGIDVGADAAAVIQREGIDTAFITLHGAFGEDGCVQGLLELLKIPYTGSGVLASALAMHKRYAKTMFSAHGLLAAPFCSYQKHEVVDISQLPFGLPAVIKPAQGGSSIGVTIVKAPSEFPAALELAFSYGGEILVEQFIKGQEVQVGILNDQPIGAIEIVPHNEFYDNEAKYKSGKADHIYPARLSSGVYRKALEVGLAAHHALGCQGYSRVDLIITEAGDCYVLEVNTLPGMTATSLLPEIAEKGACLSFAELVVQILEGASLKNSFEVKKLHQL